MSHSPRVCRRAPFVVGLPSRSWCAQCSVVRRVADTGALRSDTAVGFGAATASPCS